MSSGGDGKTDGGEVRQTVREYVRDELLYGEEDSLKDDTPLITGGILDSITTIRLTAFLEATYGIKFAAHEMGVDHLDSIDLIVQSVEAKRREK